jgi:hypothetical protein
VKALLYVSTLSAWRKKDNPQIRPRPQLPAQILGPRPNQGISVLFLRPLAFLLALLLLLLKSEASRPLSVGHGLLQFRQHLPHVAAQHVCLGPPFRQAVLVLVAVVEALEELEGG